MDNIREMARAPKQEWLKECCTPTTKYKHSINFNSFCNWANTTDVEPVNECKVSDPREFSKKWGKLMRASLSRYYVLKNVGETLAFEMFKMAVNNLLTKVYYVKVATCNSVI
jgi:hypothetical protein